MMLGPFTIILQGGDDEMTGGTGYNEIYGDAGRIYSNTGIPTPGTIYDNSQGGDDILIGGEGVNVMFGDAGTSIYDNSQGGDDVMNGGDEYGQF